LFEVAETEVGLRTIEEEEELLIRPGNRRDAIGVSFDGEEIFLSFVE